MTKTEPRFTEARPQYVFINFGPGVRWNQNDPATVTDALFDEPLSRVGRTADPTGTRRLGLSFILSYLHSPPDRIDATLGRILDLSLGRDVPVLVVLDGQNWWGHRHDLWNWWDPAQPGYRPANRLNVEWTGWGPEHAVKICWRNWGRQIRVLPAPNLAAPRFRRACETELRRLARRIKEWADRLPPDMRHLFPGVKVGWETSVGVNAYHYPGGNRYAERYPSDPSRDPQHGLDMKKDFAGGLAPLGYAALVSRGGSRLIRGGPVTLADQEQISADYLRFLAGVCRRAGLKRDEIMVHAGGQFAPWERHYSHATALNPDSVPGWSLYNRAPEDAGDLAAVLAKAGRQDWCAAEWLSFARTADGWAEAFERTLDFRRCRSLSVYNWESIHNRPDALEGLRRTLAKPPR